MTTKRKSAVPKSTEILIVEDSLTQASQIKHLLESHHYAVTVAKNGKLAMDRLLENKPSLVISDILMPEMNGYELCKEIKFNKSTEDIHVILLTRLTDPEEIIEGLSCGADSFITKPYNEKYLLSHIEKILSEGNGAEHKKVPFGAQIIFKGKKRLIQAEQQNVINLMLSIYEGAILQNEKLIQTQEELRLLNERLESLVEDRTVDLSEEIKLSNQIANRLKESEERFRILYNDAVVGLYRTNLQGEIFLANKTLVKMLGFQSFEELALRNLKETGYGPTYQRHEFIDQIEKSGEVKDLEAIWICRDGKEIVVRESARAIYDSDGKILYYDGTVQNISEQKKTAEALNRIQNLFETLTQVSPVGIFRTDQDGNTTYVNPKWMELSGLSLKEAFGNGWLNAVHPEDRKGIFESWLNNLKSKNESSAEYRFLKPDGSIVWVIGKAVPEWINDKIIGFIGTITDITERKRAEKTLLENEEFTRRLIESSNDSIKVLDLEGNLLFISAGGQRLLEIDDITVYLNKSWVDFWEGTDRESALDAILKAKKGYAGIFTGYCKTEKGTPKWWEIIISPIKDSNSNIFRLLAISRDITERKLAEDILRNSEERFKILFDYAPDAYYLNDFKGNFIDGNIACEKLMGYDKNELIGKNFLKLKLLSLTQLPKAAKLLVKNSLGHATGPDEFELKRKDGSQVTVEIITHPVKIKDKTLVLGMARDISERVQAEKLIRESEEKYRRIFENVQDLYYETSIDGTILEVSPSIGILSKGQYQTDDLIGKSMFDFYSEPSERQALLAILLEKGTVTDFELTLKNKDGSQVPCSISSKICFDAQGRPAKIIGSMHDITDRKNAIDALKFAKEKAEASDKLKTSFLNNISHEVRTPLNGILGFADILSQPDLSEEDRTFAYATLHLSSDRLLDTITNYMDISLITSGNMTVCKKEFLPAEVLNELLRKYTPVCLEKNLKLSLNIPDQEGRLVINSDPEKVHKIVSHLLNNAVKFTEKGNIEFGYLIKSKIVEFFVSDSGIGMRKESVEPIFGLFVKEDKSPLKLTEGSGLGLSISKGFIKLLGGNIWVESEEGAGAKFYFSLPYIPEAGAGQNIPSGIHFKQSGKNKLVLVAEDDQSSFHYINTILKRETSATILHASNGREAIDMFIGNPDIVLVLMDIKMPEIDGLEATRQIKLNRKEVPVIAITAFAMSGDKEAALDAGCDGYLSKPINKKDLIGKIAEFVEI